jgi:hypothetical protein
MTSRYHNMKELRPPSSGTTEICIPFAFDPAARPPCGVPIPRPHCELGLR